MSGEVSTCQTQIKYLRISHTEPSVTTTVHHCPAPPAQIYVNNSDHYQTLTPE